jgi:hypothetical protein
MPDFNFRLRFHLPSGSRIESHSEKLFILEETDGKRLYLCSGVIGTPIKEHSHAALIGGRYSSGDEAREAAERAKKALLTWAVQQRLGIDLGDGHQRSILTNAGREMLEREFKKPIRNDIHGIDVYEHQENLMFVLMHFDAILGKSPETFIEQIATSFRNPLVLTEKQILAAELYCASFFDVSFRSRLITLVTAIEALLEPAPRSPDVQMIVSTMETMVRQTDIDQSIKEAMIGSLQWLRQDSIGQAGRDLCMHFLGSTQYFGMVASRFFSYCYELRSQILHFGKPIEDAVDLLAVSNTCQAFVADLLLASFGVTT